MTVAVPSAARLPAVAVKLIDDPEPTGTLAGTVRALLSLPTVNVMPPDVTVFDKVTVQLLLAPDPRLDGVQATELTVTGATRLMAVLADEVL